MCSVKLLDSARLDIKNNVDWFKENVSEKVAIEFYQEVALFMDGLSSDIIQNRFVYKDFKRVILKKFNFAVYYKTVNSVHFIYAVIAHKQEVLAVLKSLK